MAAGAAMRSALRLNLWAGHGYYSLDISLLLHQHFDEVSEKISYLRNLYVAASLTIALPRSFTFLKSFLILRFRTWNLMVTKHV